MTMITIFVSDQIGTQFFPVVISDNITFREMSMLREERTQFVLDVSKSYNISCAVAFNKGLKSGRT